MLATVLIVSLAAVFKLSDTVKAVTATSISINASATSLCAYSPITITATINGGSSPKASSIEWATNSSTGTFSSPTSTSTTSTVTYVDTSSGTVTITASYPGDSNNGASSSAVTLTIYNLDFLHEGVVNFQDVVYFAQAYIAYQTSNVYNAAIDLNHDGVINFNDITLFVALYDSYQGPV